MPSVFFHRRRNAKSAAAIPNDYLSPAEIPNRPATNAASTNPFSTAYGELEINVLWIDDDVRDDDASVKLLGLEGFCVTCAASGAEGLQTAREGHFDAIILDLRLPDMDGLAVLKQFWSQSVQAAVLVLTGFGDIETAVTALKLGAVDFEQKPLSGEDLVDAIRSILRPRDLSGVSGDPNRWRPTDVSIVRSYQRRLLEEASNHLFVFRASAFRAAIMSRHTSSPREGRSGMMTRMMYGEYEHVPAAVLAALDHLRHGLGQGAILGEDAVARRLGLTSSELGHLFNAHLGVGFREVRRLLRLRPALRDLALSTEQVSQIAYRSGFEHLGQFDRDFRITFGLTPLEFRRLWDDAESGTYKDL